MKKQLFFYSGHMYKNGNLAGFCDGKLTVNVDNKEWLNSLRSEVLRVNRELGDTVYLISIVPINDLIDFEEE